MMYQIVTTGLLLFTMAGCSKGEKDLGPSGGVSGTITFKGKPVQEGTVFFEDSSKGLGGKAPISPPGAFKSTMDLPQGKYKVTVLPLPPKDASGQSLASEAADIPRKYHNAKTSGLTIDISPGANNLKIELE